MAGGGQPTGQVGVWVFLDIGLHPFLLAASRAAGREVMVAPLLLSIVVTFTVPRVLLPAQRGVIARRFCRLGGVCVRLSTILA